jgi:hypothetical protein
MVASDAVPKAVAKVGKAGTSADYSRGDHQHALDPNLFPQPLGVQKNDVDIGSRQCIDFKEGGNVTLTVEEDAGNERVKVTIAAAGGGGGDMYKATYDTNDDGIVDNADKVDLCHAGVAANDVFKILAAIASGDIFYVNATPNIARLAKSTDGKYLKLVSGFPAWTAPTATITRTFIFGVEGTLTTGTNKTFEIVADGTLTIVKVKAHVKTAPTGATLIVDVNKAGTTIFTNQANRPTIAIGATDDDSGTPDVTALAEGNVLSIDIDQIGSTVAGADLTVEVVCVQAVTFS